MRVKIDVGAGDYLPCCPCGWRGLPALDRREALSQARRHEVRGHPGDSHVLRQIHGLRS